MVKVYKQKEKLVLYVPFEVTAALGIKENDEVDFFKFNNKSFLFAKKSDITNMLVGTLSQESKTREQEPRPKEAQVQLNISENEIRVLKKLDTLRYSQRTKDALVKLLDPNEKEIVRGLIKRKIVIPYAKEKGKAPLYSISKNVYDRFLMRKKQADGRMDAGRTVQQPRPQINFGRPAGIENENVKTLEQKGFVVLPTESEASSLSLALEDSVRHGMIVGTRAFNKKFYIVLRSFFDANSSKILKALKDGNTKIADLSKSAGVEEDAARAILYLLAESGDVSERRRDIFELAS